MRAAGFVVLAMTAACGLDESGLMPFAGPVPEAGADVAAPNDGAPVDATPQETGQESGPPQPCSTPPGACVAAVPNGWTLVAFDATGAATCPANYVGAATISEPQAGSGACDCSCAVTSSPTCESGTLQRYISTDQSCNQTGVTFNVNGAGCNALGNTGPLSSYSKSTALGPTGGTCSTGAVSNEAAVTTQAGRACAPPTECEEDLLLGQRSERFRDVHRDRRRANVPGGVERDDDARGRRLRPRVLGVRVRSRRHDVLERDAHVLRGHAVPELARGAPGRRTMRRRSRVRQDAQFVELPGHDEHGLQRDGTEERHGHAHEREDDLLQIAQTGGTRCLRRGRASTFDA